MSDNKRQDDSSLLVAQLAGVLAVAFVFAPMLQGLAVVGLVIAVGVGFGLVMYWANNTQAAPPSQPTQPPAESAEPTVEVTDLAAEVADGSTGATDSSSGAPAGPAEVVDLPLEAVESPAPVAPFGPPCLPETRPLLERLRAADPQQFAKVVEVTCRKLGYAVSHHGGQDGIDLIVENESGCSAMHCRHWNAGNVEPEVVREFAEALTGAHLTRGVLLTLGDCTPEAKRVAGKSGIEILDATSLNSLLRAVDAENAPEIQSIHNDPRKLCPECEAELVPSTLGEEGQAGFRFWRCSTRPKCQYTVPML